MNLRNVTSTSLLLTIGLLLTAACADDTLGPDGSTPDVNGTDGSADTNGMDARGSDGGADTTQRPDAGPIDCASVESSGFTLCEATRETCSLIFEDSTGCPAACARIGLECEASYDLVTDMCDESLTMPLGCADSGHQSDYCVCGAAPGPDAGPEEDAGLGVDAGPDAQDAGPADGGPFDAGVAPPCPGDRPWECILDEALGFGAGVTGGAGGPLCWVENLNTSGTDSLQACIDEAGPTWIVFRVSGTIRINTDLASDTTIDGRGQNVVLESAGGGNILRMNGASNVFITYLSLQNAPNDTLQARPSSSNIWLHHLSLTGAGDELLDMEAPNSTLSWSRLHDNHYAILSGGEAMEYPGLWFTMHHNLIAECDQRHPRTRGRIHSFNNYIRGFMQWGAGITNGGQLASERNIYQSTGGVHPALSSRSSAPGHFRSVEDRFLGTAAADDQNDPSPVFDPSTMYSYTAEEPTDAMAVAIETGAGWQDVPLPL